MQVTPPPAARAADLCRKCQALADTQQRAGEGPAALASLTSCTLLLLRLGCAEPAVWQPLVQAYVRLQGEQLQHQGGVSQAADGAAPSARRGRGAAVATSKKGCLPPADAAGAAAQASQSAAPLFVRLELHAAEMPAGSVASVLESELAAWAGWALEEVGAPQASSPASSSSAAAADGSAAAQCRSVVRKALVEVYPAARRPLEHAGVLLVLHRLGLSADGGVAGAAAVEEELLQRAVDTLEEVRGHVPPAH